MSECYLCHQDFDRIDAHHLNYQENITINVCKRCHENIHHTDKYLDLKPIDKKIKQISYSKTFIISIDEKIFEAMEAKRKSIGEKNRSSIIQDLVYDWVFHPLQKPKVSRDG